MVSRVEDVSELNNIILKPDMGLKEEMKEFERSEFRKE